MQVVNEYIYMYLLHYYEFTTLLMNTFICIYIKKTLQSITLDDIAGVDPDLHRSLQWLLHNDVTQLDTTFSVEHEAFGELRVHELKAGGKDLPVTQVISSLLPYHI